MLAGFVAVPQVSLAGMSNFNDFTNLMKADDQLKAFGKDIGAILGGGTFSTADVAGSPGVDLSARVCMLGKVSDDDVILKDFSLIGLPFAQLDIGLVKGIGLTARFFSISNVTLIGFGAKYKVLDNYPVPIVSGLVTYHTISGSADLGFKISTISINAIASEKVAIATFYCGAGLDFTSIKTTSIAGFALDLKANPVGYRAVLGLRLNVLPVVYLNGDIGLANSAMSYNAGLGIGFGL